MIRSVCVAQKDVGISYAHTEYHIHKYLLKTLATFISVLIISSDSSKKMFSGDFILLEAVAKNFLLSLMYSKIFLVISLSFFDKIDTNIPLFIVLSSWL